MNKVFRSDSMSGGILKMDNIAMFRKDTEDEYIAYMTAGGDHTCYIKYSGKSDRDKDYDRLVKLMEEKKMNYLRDYFERHKDGLITLAVVIIVDHIFLDGALRSKTQAICEGLLNRSAKQLEDPK